MAVREKCVRCGGEMMLGRLAPIMVECAGCGRTMPPLANVKYRTLPTVKQAVANVRELREAA